MRKLLLTFALCAAFTATAQYRRRIPSPSKPGDITGQLVVTFHGKLKDIGAKEITIETEDQPSFLIGRSRQTKFLKDGKPVKAEAISAGTPVSVDVRKDPDLKPLAVSVTVESPATNPDPK